LANLLVPTFILAWFSLRVLVVAKNKGQSLGRYALDLKVVDPQYGRVPGIMELCQREGIHGPRTFVSGAPTVGAPGNDRKIGTGAMLALIGIYYLSPVNAWALLLMIPVLIDCGFAYIDRELRQAFHDQIADTIVVGVSKSTHPVVRLLGNDMGECLWKRNPPGLLPRPGLTRPEGHRVEDGCKKGRDVRK
jgi:hypothetical protein